MKFSVGDYYVKLGSSPGSIDSEFKHPYLINSLLLPIFLDLLMALVILLCIFSIYSYKHRESQQQQCMITTQNNHYRYTKCDANTGTIGTKCDAI